MEEIGRGLNNFLMFIVTIRYIGVSLLT